MVDKTSINLNGLKNPAIIDAGNGNLVSVLMPVFNAEKHIHRSIASLIAQTYQNWELICVNDGSTDKSLEILSYYAQKDKRIKVFSIKNSGPAKARAYGAKHAKGDYIIYLDADDCYEEGLLQSCVMEFIIDSTNDIVMPNLIIEKKKGETYYFEDQFEKFKIATSGNIDINTAFVKSLKWEGIHSFFMSKVGLFKKIACDKEYLYGNFNSDELITRVLLLNAKKISLCRGKCFYNYNSESITKKMSIKVFGYLETNIKLIELAKKYNQKKSTIAGIKLYSMNEMTNLYISFLENKNVFTTIERKQILARFQASYKLLDKKELITSLTEKGITQRFQILLLLNKFCLYKLTLNLYYSFLKLFRIKNEKIKNKIIININPAQLETLDNAIR